MSDKFCNNCNKHGHIYNQCKIPITSYGIIAFRYKPTRELGKPTEPKSESESLEFLMIRRKDTLGFVDFMRGKYMVQNKQYITNMVHQMTVQEKEGLKNGDFNYLWRNLWGEKMISSKYRLEENLSRSKFNMLYSGVVNKNDYFTLNTIIDESDKTTTWTEPEWGFPKGRKNYQEKDMDCAIREFCEETGYSSDILNNIKNIIPYEEIFIGSNYKSYKHKYYLMYIQYEDSLVNTNFEKEEVSKMEWKNYTNCIDCIRPYNLEKKRVITNIYNGLIKYKLLNC